jgi:hypothetical protein
MPEANQYVFTHKELVEMMIKKTGLHEGKWILQATFTFAAINGGPSPDQLIPTAIVGLQSVGLQKALPGAPPSLTVDAAEANPPEGAKSKREKSLTLPPS